MWLIAKILLALVVLAIAAQQLGMYYNIVLMGNYMFVAPISNVIIVGVFWPLAVVLIAGSLIWAIFKFLTPKHINFN